MNTPPRSPPRPPATKARHNAEYPAELGFYTSGDLGSINSISGTASSPNYDPDLDTSLPTSVDSTAVRATLGAAVGVEVGLDEAYLDSEHNDEASASSEALQIYSRDTGLEGSVGSSRAFGNQITDGPTAADSPLLPSGAWRQDTTSPLAPSHSNMRTPLSMNTHSASTRTRTNTSDSTIDSGPTTTTPTTDINSGPSPSRSTATLHPHSRLESAALRSQLLSPVGDLVDSPVIPPATRMNTVPLPYMDDPDDPTSLLPRSLEQMAIREVHDALKKSPKEKERVRGLTAASGGVLHITPPPPSPLSALSGNGLATQPNMSPFATSASPLRQQNPFDLNASSLGKGGSIPTTPTIGVMQQTTSYTQSQPLPQLPTFAPALSAIKEGEHRMSKDDSHLDNNIEGGGGERREHGMYGEEGEEMQANKADSKQRQLSNVTILPVYQQYGTITVSNSVVSFPNQPTQTTTPPSNMSHGLATGSIGSGERSGSEEGAAGLSGQQQKTPNVYINGLPPQFPEEDLHALAAPFGEVKSVRTFTRHVRDTESGYGFVLFETVDAAERCIVALRRNYRHLHPTFAKQIHKIPGTIYAQPLANGHEGSDSASSQCAFNWDGPSSEDPDDADASFKARMEALADPMSTNLYMEGLPLSMDEPTLSALVSPHRVISSRFFQTRLSNPPRIIAFVRLETRSGAQDVIERLHGRMVRGWNDAGSRISVRFADTSEQRELRRQERAVKEGGPSSETPPSRLTIAQAALLNLRGQGVRPVESADPSAKSGSSTTTSLPSVTSPLAMKSAPVNGSADRGVLDWPGREPLATSLPDREVIGSSREYVTNSALSSAGQGLALGPSAAAGIGGARTSRLGNGAAGIDYGSAFSGPLGSLPRDDDEHHHQRQYQSMDRLGDGMTGMGINVGGNMRSPYPVDYSIRPGRSEPLSIGGHSSTDPTMRALLESLGGGVSQQQQQEFYRMQLERATYYQQQPSVHQLLQYPPSYQGSGVASTHTGYTPAEEYIMRVHAESAARQREYDPTRIAILQQQQQAAAQRKRPTPLDLGRQNGGGQRQDENGADITMGVRGYRMQASLVGMSDEEAFHAQVQARDEREAEHQHQQQLDEHEQQLQQQQQGGRGHHAHTRATTLPHQQHQRPHRNSLVMASPGPLSAAVGGPTGRGQGQRHYQHNSMSVSSTTALRTPQHAFAATMGGTMNNMLEQQQQNSNGQHQKRMSMGGDGPVKSRPSYAHQNRDLSQVPRQDMGYDDPSLSPASSADSPCLISPALTYSSQTHTPSTLSPATPFFGSFNSQGDGFRGAGVIESSGKASVEGGGKSGGSVAHSLKSRLA